MTAFESKLKKLESELSECLKLHQSTQLKIKKHLLSCPHPRTEDDRLWPQCFPIKRCSVCRKILEINR
jgi:hypothetical protein